MRIISPSILSADFLNLGREIDMLNQSRAEWIHFDVMDGLFVPNISFGFPILSSVRSTSNKVLDVHLMIVNPENYVERFAKAGADMITFHYEACENPLALIEQIKQLGCKAGISIKPATPAESVKELLPYLDLVLIMGVEPGFGGQKIFESTYDKTRTIAKYIADTESSAVIEVDGGTTPDNARALFDAGATALVAGTAVFASENPQQTIEQLLNV